MIAPLPPQPGRPPVDSASVGPDPKGGGNAFTDILAAAAASVAPAPHLPGPSPLEHGPALVAVANLSAPEPVQTPVAVAGLTDPASELVKPGHARQSMPAARIFNQDGFFSVDVGAATRLADSHDVTAAVTPLSQAGAVPMPVAHQSDRLPGVEPVPDPIEMVLTEPSSPTRPDVTPAITPQRTKPAAPRALAAPVVRARIADAEGELDPVQPLARRFTLREPGARAAVQVAMHEVEQEVDIAARADGLDAAERLRLRDEITALLARHGLSARSIRVSPPARGARAGERLK